MKGKKPTKWPFLISSLILIFASILVIGSFFSSTIPSLALNNLNKTDNLPENGPLLVFIVIDAWRLNFLTAEKSPMKFIKNSISNKNAILFNTYARMPTVTLPRITSYITGTLPTFGAILTNLATEEIRIDNWVENLQKNGKKLHFYGDDTWLKLLPNRFETFEGTTSFFVHDYTEVDNNVTKHLNKELNNDEWDCLILHYLGLDHIGHSLGGTSEKIVKKLEEMDEIAEKIYNKLIEKHKKLNRNIIMIVCGDHGMTLGGSHGGASFEESHVPSVIWNIGKKQKKPFSKNEQIEQIDIAATIFSLFGIQMNGYGISLLHEIMEEKMMPSYWQNQYEHFKKLSNDYKIIMKLTCDEDNKCDFSTKAIQDSLINEMKRIQKLIIEKSAEIPNTQLIISILFFILAAIVSSIGWINVGKKSEKPDFAFFILNLLCLSSSFIEEEHEIWYFISSLVLLLEAYKMCRVRKQTNILNKKILEMLGLSILHRIGIGWNQSMRRRWVMDEDVLPKSIFFELLNLKILDFNSILINHPLISLIIATIGWNCVLKSKTLKTIILFPIFSHIFREFGFRVFDAYIMSLFRLIILPASYYYGYFDIGIVSLILIVVPVSQLPLLFLIYLMAILLKKYELNNWKLTAIFISTFYYTGNSNSLSTLSLSSAYVGLLDYYPILVGIQLILNTFSGPAVFILAWSSNKSLRNDSKYCLKMYFLTFRITSIVFSLICLFIHQHHLFVWSVYTPKAIYDIFQSIFAVVINFY